MSVSRLRSKGKLAEVGVNVTVGPALKFIVVKDISSTGLDVRQGEKGRPEWRIGRIASRLYTVDQNTGISKSITL